MVQVLPRYWPFNALNPAEFRFLNNNRVALTKSSGTKIPTILKEYLRLPLQDNSSQDNLCLATIERNGADNFKDQSYNHLLWVD